MNRAIGRPTSDASEKREGYWRRIYRARARVLIRFVPWAIVSVLIAGISFVFLRQVRMEPLSASSETTLGTAVTRLTRTTATLLRDIRFVANNETIRAMVDSPSRLTFDAAASFLSAFLQGSSSYYEARWIDEDGMERLRLNLVDGTISRVAEKDLQSMSHRYYVDATMKLDAQSVYLSPLDLKAEENVVEIPAKPTIRVAMPLLDIHGQKKGMFILNYQGQVLLDSLHRVQVIKGGDLELVNSDGFWLMSPDPRDSWGFMFQGNTNTLARRFPAVWESARKMDSGSFQDATGFWAFASVRPTADSDPNYMWTLFVHIDPKISTAITTSSLLICVVGGLFLVAFSFFVTGAMGVAGFEREESRRLLTLRGEELQASNASLESSLNRLRLAHEEIIRAGRLSSLGMMVAGVAHELNSPLGASIVTLSVLQDARKSLGQTLSVSVAPAELRQYLETWDEGSEIIASNLKRAASLVKSFKQLAADRATAERRSFDLAELVDDMLRTSWLGLKKRAPEFETTVQAGIEMESYPGALGQVMENLVSNALSHAYRGLPVGHIGLDARLDTDGKWVLIRIEDRGTGIESRDIAKIFDPFFTTSRNQGGTGLGLYLVWQLVTEVLGGKIKVQSEKGIGSVFTVRIPRVAPGLPA